MAIGSSRQSQIEGLVHSRGQAYADESNAAPPASRSDNTSLLIAAELPFLRRVVRRWHGVGADADDLVQDTLLRALANAHQWEPGTNLRAWLFTIMRNQFFDGRSRLKRADAACSGYADVNAGFTPEHQDTRLLLRDVNRVIDRLPKVQRIALLLVGVEGRSHEDVAQLLELSAGALRCHLARARAYLRKAIYVLEHTSPLADARAVRTRNSLRVVELRLVK